MLRVLNRKYTITVTVVEGSDEWWEEITRDGRSGCDDVVEAVEIALQQVGMQPQVMLSRFSWE